jgi:hypothetical protein
VEPSGRRLHHDVRLGLAAHHWRERRAVEVDEQRPHPLDVFAFAALAVGLVDGDVHADAVVVEVHQLAPIFVERAVEHAREVACLAVLVVVQGLEREAGGGRVEQGE